MTQRTVTLPPKLRRVDVDPWWATRTNDNTGKQVLGDGESWADSVTVFDNQGFLVEGVVGNIPN